MDLHDLTIKDVKADLKKKKYSSVDLTKTYLDRIKQIDTKINAYITVCEEDALKEASRADKLLASGQDLPLLGIPFSIKDNFCTQGVRTTASSKVLDEFIPPYDATVVRKLKDAGMVMIGKTNMDAWAHGSSTETSDYGATKNPWNVEFLPGGSSGGAAATIAADEALAAIGSETAGSVRQPAAWCGVVGLKPTYGRVSRYGVIAMGSSLDSPGPITKTVADSALILNVLAGLDPYDATSSPKKVENYLADIDKSIDGLRIGISDDYFEGVDPQIQEKVMDGLKELEKLGAKIHKIKLFEPRYAIAVYTILQRAEVSSNLARYDGVRFGNDRTVFGSEAKRRIMFGTYALSSGYYDQYYNKALKVRTVIVNDFYEAFKRVDVIIGPTCPSTALPLGSSKNHPMFGEMSDILVEPSSIAGLPGINVPCGFSREGLPIGMQIIGPQFAEKLIINVAAQYEKMTDFKKKEPKL